jgi:Zn-dependent peptidase ImmA (M78 family)
MKIHDLITEGVNKSFDFAKMMQDFLPIVMDELDLDVLPRIKLEARVRNEAQPTFGRFVVDQNIIYLAMENRHPNDIARTLAHELVHFKQGQLDQLDTASGETGSNEENQANALAGVIMRNFNKKYPQYLKSKPLDFSDK